MWNSASTDKTKYTRSIINPPSGDKGSSFNVDQLQYDQSIGDSASKSFGELKLIYHIKLLLKVQADRRITIPFIHAQI